ncbi:transferase [Aureococcus anophagefferens]|nr:transferase [Aureococcus anophagefferens]
MSLKAALVLAPAVLAAWHPEDSALINDEQHVNYLNQEEMSWKAGVNERFAGMTYADWKGLVQPIRDQQQCGSCWAFSAAEVLSDRNAIQHNKAEPVLSPEDLVSCDRVDQGCNGGNLGTAWTYLRTRASSPTPASLHGRRRRRAQVRDVVQGRLVLDEYKAASAYAVNGVENMQKEIMTHGPIQVAFNVYKSFMSYKSGVYAKKWYELMPEGGHAVKIVGWGTEGGKDCWLVANSWNTSWGDEGYFKIVRGSDNCGIETRGPPYAGLAAM